MVKERDEVRRASVIGYVLVLGLVTRLIMIDQSFWLDEATSGLVVRNFGVAEIYEFAKNDFHPPLYYLALKGWSEIFGTGEAGLRLLSVAFGVGTIYVVYLIGKELRDKTLGMLVGLLVATAPLHVYYSQEARMYAMAALAVSLGVYFFVRVSGKKTKSWEWIGFSSCLALIFLTDYVAFLVMPVFWISGWMMKKKRVWWKKFLISQVMWLVALVAWWPIFYQQLGGGLGVKSVATGWWGILGRTSVKNVLLIPVKFMIGRIGLSNKWLYGAVVLVVGSVFGYLLKVAWKEQKKLRLIWLWLIVPVGLAILIGFGVPILSYFRLLFVLPAFYVLVAVGLLGVKEKYFLPVLMVVMMINFGALGIYFRNSQFQREDWRGLVEMIGEESKDKKAKVIFVANSQMEGYRYYDPEANISGPEGIGEGLDQIWLMRYVWDVFDPSDSVRERVEELGYEKTGEHDYNGVVVWKYENRD